MPSGLQELSLSLLETLLEQPGALTQAVVCQINLLLQELLLRCVQVIGTELAMPLQVGAQLVGMEAQLYMGKMLQLHFLEIQLFIHSGHLFIQSHITQIPAQVHCPQVEQYSPVIITQ